jgi:hypothetical protein
MKQRWRSAAQQNGRSLTRGCRPLSLHQPELAIDDDREPGQLFAVNCQPPPGNPSAITPAIPCFADRCRAVRCLIDAGRVGQLPILDESALADVSEVHAGLSRSMPDIPRGPPRVRRGLGRDRETLALRFPRGIARRVHAYLGVLSAAYQPLPHPVRVCQHSRWPSRAGAQKPENLDCGVTVANFSRRTEEWHSRQT